MRHTHAHPGALVLVVCLCCASLFSAETSSLAVSTPKETDLASAFETSAQPWTLPAEAPVRSAIPSDGGLWDLRNFKSLSIQARVKKSGPGAVHVHWRVKSRLAGLYSTARGECLPDDRSAPLVANFEELSTNLIPVGHQRPWDAQAAAEIENIELRVDYAFAGSASDVLALSLSSLSLVPMQKNSSPAVIRDLSVLTAPANYRAAALVEFRIDPQPDDPYSTDGEGDVRIRLSDGGEFLAYLQQDQNVATDGRVCRFASARKPYWCAYLPELSSSSGLEIVSGKRHWKISAQSVAALSQPSVQTELSYDDIEPTGRWHAPLRVATPSHAETWGRAPSAWHLESNGQWKAQPSKALKGVSSLWRPVPFWNSAWAGFADVTRPNFALAESMQWLLDRAATANSSQPMVILDGESYDRQGTFNWESHPLKPVLSGPGELLVSERGLDFSRRWMRYCIARWGMSKAVSALCITTDISSPLTPDFHVRLANALKALNVSVLPDPSIATQSAGIKSSLPVLSLHPLAQMPDTVKPLNKFGAEAWAAENDGTRVQTAQSKESKDAASVLEFHAVKPESRTAGLIVKYTASNPDWSKIAPDDFSGADALLFDLWVPNDAPQDLRVGVHVRDRDNLWFEAMLPGLARPGEWCTYALDLTGNNAQQLSPLQHKKTWTDYSRQRIREIGLHLFSVHANWTPHGAKTPQVLSARIQNIRAARFEHNEPATPVTLTLVDPSSQLTAPQEPLKPESTPVTHVEFGELWQCHISCNKTFSNPFDVRVCDLTAVITTPSGKIIRIPAFFNQLCERREATPGGAEIIEPVGREFFTLRYRPVETGEHRIKLELREGGNFEVETVWQADPRFTPAGEPQAAIGFQKDATPNYPTNFTNGRRKIDNLKFVPGQVTADLELPALTVGDAPTVAEKKLKGIKAFRGFVRIAEDKRHFQFDDGTFYYPIGPCLRSPSDWRLPYGDKKWTNEEINRIAARGTYQFDDYFSQFEKAGISWARMWMCSWWCGLEWRRDWPGYQGLGRYNLENAWRMDYVLDEAEKKGVRMEINLTNHGQLSLMVDTEWKESPYNKELGGPYLAPSEFFTRADAKIAHKNKLRYILARYGHSPAIMAWELLSEMEYCEEYAPALVGLVDTDRLAPNINAWHSEMSAFLKANDPAHRMVTTHSAQAKHAERVFGLPDIDFSTSNAYSATWPAGEGRDDASQALADFWAGAKGKHEWLKGFARLGKPAIVQEQGAHWEGVEPSGKVNNTLHRLDTDLHAEMWGSMVQPLAGATGYWWWLHLHFDNRYQTYRALANFMEGEDMRPGKDEALLEPVFRKINDDLLGRALKSDRRLYAWIYHRKTPLGPEVPVIPDAVMHIGGLKAGKYKAEFWDTYAGTLSESLDVEVKEADGKPQAFELPLPAVKRDLAIKIKPAGP